MRPSGPSACRSDVSIVTWHNLTVNDIDMASLPTGVSRRGSVFWLRVGIPLDLRHLYPRTGHGRLAIDRHRASLQTTDPALARVRASALKATFDAEFHEKRTGMVGSSSIKLTPVMLSVLQDRIRQSILAGDDMRRANPGGASWPLKLGEVPEDPWGRLEYMQNVDNLMAHTSGLMLSAGETLLGRTYADMEAQKLGISGIEWTGEHIALMALTRTVAQAHMDVARRSQGHLVDTPAPVALTPVEQPLHLRDVVADWKAAKAPTEDSIARAERALRHMVDAGQDVPLGELTRTHGAKVRAYLLDTGARGFKGKTALNLWQALGALLNVALDVGKVDRNPWAGMSFEVKDSETRESFTAEELKVLFGSALHTEGCWPTVQKVDPQDGYWCTLMLLWSGARVGELAQLELADVVAENGVHALSVHARAAGSTVKTAESVRRIPIPDEMVRLGFLERVQGLRDRGETKLFPTFHRPGKVAPGEIMSEWFKDFRSKVKAAPGPLNGTHRFRHTIRTALAALHVGVETADALTGHAAQGSSGRKVYTHVGLATVKAALERVSWPLALPRVFPGTPKASSAL